MKIPSAKLILCLVFLSLLSTQCEEDILVPSFEEDQQELLRLKTEIENLANESICGDTYQCKYIAFGSKPCGGAWTYLIYSTSIDTENLENLVENYNQQETDFNNKWEVVSDCSVNTPPINLNCDNNKCKAIY